MVDDGACDAAPASRNVAHSTRGGCALDEDRRRPARYSRPADFAGAALRRTMPCLEHSHADRHVTSADQ